MACVLVLDRAGRRGTYGAIKIWGEASCQDANEDHRRVFLANDGVRDTHPSTSAMGRGLPPVQWSVCVPFIF